MYLEQLSPASRVKMDLRNDRLTPLEHMLVSVMDGLISLNYQTSIVAAGTVGDAYSGLMDDAPKVSDRPKIRWDEEEEVYEFTPIKDLKATGLFQVNP